MQARYVPGAPNPWFARHKYHGIPIHRNIKPIAECKLHHCVGPAATVEKAIGVPILTPEHLWGTFQVEAEKILTIDGSLEGNDRERNRRINAAYAKLWLADNRFQWAGLAAFASKQVGCGLLHSAEVSEKNRRVREQVGHAFAAYPGAGASTLVQSGTEAAAQYMYTKLGFGNAHLFLDIYPLHRFFMERGWNEFDTYLSKRQNEKYSIYWAVNRETLRFGTPFAEIKNGFAHIHSGKLLLSVEHLAQHEQVNVLQKIMYNDLVLQKLLAMNQYAWATGFPTGDYQEIKLTLSAECRAKTGFTSWFSRNKNAQLWVVEQRMPFVLAAARQFHDLLNGPERPYVEASIRAIAAGGSVA
ncbi:MULTISPECIES: DUF2515 family protein [unclassified Massilia]|uniref:DUF2515 family protein n=1 Tax=unclassified Massilia TaxID=2609279 RepID=UPI00177FDDCB|nr:MULTISPECIES: hypothetical protein [unclassified Massilia]MBD8529880.1 hypothetical protein [Massilia sp. CFBP 13647]MBD8672108.1 hypothetical protein [Massilia sp. CFBP 13721]